jgi:site-specific DNA-methyltransferase (adenine-specific)
MTSTTDTATKPEVAYEAPGVTLWRGDCRDVMRDNLAADSIHAIVTDPPYDLTAGKKGGSGAASVNLKSPAGRARISAGNGGGFMGQDWDATGVAFEPETWAEAYRVLKPGGYLLAFGGSRTWHRMAVAIEAAGFEIRDSIAWLYGSGFPKSMDVSKAIDAAAGATREVIGFDASKARPNKQSYAKVPGGERLSDGGLAGYQDNGATITAPATDAAKEWDGWGTALKPGFEPIVVARKPIPGTIAANVQLHRTGVLNVDATRVPYADEADRAETTNKNQHGKFGTEAGGNAVYGDYSMVAPKDYDSSKGRWPTNVVFTHSPLIDPATGDVIGDACANGCVDGCAVAKIGRAGRIFPTFRYEAKAPSHERPVVDDVQHPTVKPLGLMRWLVRLVVADGGTVLDLFTGSGTTLEAALIEGANVVGVEGHPPYIPLIVKRITKPLQTSMFGDWEGDAA